MNIANIGGDTADARKALEQFVAAQAAEKRAAEERRRSLAKLEATRRK